MFLDVVVHLLQSGASTTIEDIHGDTPLDVATNDVIALAMLLHRQRLENFEFTSHERCWYRSRSIQRWRNVSHRVLWREVVHMYVTRNNDKLRMEGNSIILGNGEYLSEGASIANGSTVVDISMTPSSFLPVSLSLSRSPLF